MNSNQNLWLFKRYQVALVIGQPLNFQHTYITNGRLSRYDFVLQHQQNEPTLLHRFHPEIQPRPVAGQRVSDEEYDPVVATNPESEKLSNDTRGIFFFTCKLVKKIFFLKMLLDYFFLAQSKIFRCCRNSRSRTYFR